MLYPSFSILKKRRSSFTLSAQLGIAMFNVIKAKLVLLTTLVEIDRTCVVTDVD